MTERGAAAYTHSVASSRSKVDAAISEHTPLVHRIAHHLVARLPASVHVEDLIQAGMIGLLEAAQRFEAGRGATFSTYAGIRIRGAMLDEIRRGDWLPRSVHRNTRKIAEAIESVEKRNGQAATDREVAQALEVEIEQYHEMLRDISHGKLFSIEEMEASDRDTGVVPGDESAEPLGELTRHAFLRNLTQSISGLPEREQLVLSLYYEQELNLKEIGKVLGVSESRVSQIHSQAAARLRSRLTAWEETAT